MRSILSGLAFISLTGCCAVAAGNQAQYAGPQVCSSCHTEIAKSQAQTAMANSWHGGLPSSFALDFAASTKEGPTPDLFFEVRRVANRLQYSTTMPGGATTNLPVEAVIGGKRHGFSFLERVDQVGGVPLERPALVEARYAYDLAHKTLLLSPGFDSKRPSNYEDALGRTLSPFFERRCRTCHGQPDTLGAGSQGGVRCETCHGPAADHVASFAKKVPGSMVKPPRLAGEGELEVCGQCHTGLSDQSDAVPDDLLVSNQVPALRHSECFLQTGHAVTCSDCHDPHQDSATVTQTAVHACLGCHVRTRGDHAAICPVNAASGCIGCHMPAVKKDSFLMTDHWIRVHPEQGVQAVKRQDGQRSHVPPKHEFLRLIATGNRADGDAALQRLRNAEPFAQVARQLSTDPTAPGGGYIGDMELSQMDAKLSAAAAQLNPGNFSTSIDLGDRFVILYRMPRDFQWQADQLYQQAVALKAKGDLRAAAEKDQQALDIYPYFLRALVLMGTSVGEAGDAARARSILQFTAQAYPKDPSAQFDYALTLSQYPTQQLEAIQHALELNPDLTAAYESLGAAQFASGQPLLAIDTFRRGLQIDPLSASLNYNLSLALAQQGDGPGARQALALARQLDPNIGSRSSSKNPHRQ